MDTKEGQGKALEMQSECVHPYYFIVVTETTLREKYEKKAVMKKNTEKNK